MRIAFISYEAPPDTLIGGIGTYVGQAARALTECGHEVEVFTASPKHCGTINEGGWLTHIVQCSLKERLHFAPLAGQRFAEKHGRQPFDVLEGPEYFAEARIAKQLVPQVPLVVKLHMSRTLIGELNGPPKPPETAFRQNVCKLLRKIIRRKARNNGEFDFGALELPHLLQADEITAPSRAIAEVTARLWRLDPSRFTLVPNVFSPPAELTDIALSTVTNTVGYIGRLEQRKGVIDLAHAIPLILKQAPDTKFVFAGASLASPIPGLKMDEYLKEIIGPAMSQVTFLGKIDHPQMHKVYRAVDITVIPSLWENFPNSCLEAMAAGRGIVGTTAGGVAEQLDSGHAGLLVSPGHPDEIASAVCRLLASPHLRQELGRKARTRVLEEYNAQRITQKMEESYLRAIRQQSAGPRRWRKRCF